MLSSRRITRTATSRSPLSFQSQVQRVRPLIRVSYLGTGWRAEQKELDLYFWTQDEIERRYRILFQNIIQIDK